METAIYALVYAVQLIAGLTTIVISTMVIVECRKEKKRMDAIDEKYFSGKKDQVGA